MSENEFEPIVVCPNCGKVLDCTHHTRNRMYFDCFDCDVQVIFRNVKKAKQKVSA